MFQRSSKKLGLNQAIFLSGNFAQSKQDPLQADDLKKIKPEEIELLLKKGVLGFLDQNEQQ